MRDITQAERQSARKGALQLAPLPSTVAVSKPPPLQSGNRSAVPSQGYDWRYVGSNGSDPGLNCVSDLPNSRSSSLPPKLEPSASPKVPPWPPSHRSRQPSPIGAPLPPPQAKAIQHCWTGPDILSQQGGASSSTNVPSASRTRGSENDPVFAGVAETLLGEVVREMLVKEVVSFLVKPDGSVTTDPGAKGEEPLRVSPSKDKMKDLFTFSALAKMKVVDGSLEEVAASIAEPPGESPKLSTAELFVNKIELKTEAKMQSAAEDKASSSLQQPEDDSLSQQKRKQLQELEEKIHSRLLVKAAKKSIVTPAEEVCDTLIHEVVEALTRVEASKAAKYMANECLLIVCQRRLLDAVQSEMLHDLAQEALFEVRMESVADSIIDEGVHELLQAFASETLAAVREDEDNRLSELDRRMHLDPAIDSEFLDRVVCEHLVRTLATRADGLQLRQYQERFCEGLMAELLLNRAMMFGRQLEVLEQQQEAWAVLEGLSAEIVLDHILLEMREALDREESS